MILLVITPMITVEAQSNIDVKRFHADGDKSLRSGLALSPDENTIAIAGIKGSPLFLYDWRKDKITQEFNVGNWPGGAKVTYSEKGTYLILQQLCYLDFSPNKDREVNFEIINAENGKVVKKIDNVHSLKIASSEKFCVALTGDEVILYELPSGDKLRTFTVEKATNSVAISPDEKYIAVSHRPTLEQVKNSPTIRNDKKAKKAIKPALNYRQMISIYDAETFEKIKTVNELYDIVYNLQFSEDGKRLYNYSIPHTKMQLSSAGRQGYIYTIGTANWEPLRISFVSLASYEPEFKENSKNNLFGVVSTDGFPQINLHNLETGRLVDRFNTKQSIRDAISEKMAGDSRLSFAFLPDDSVILVNGNSMYKWKPDLK